MQRNSKGANWKVRKHEVLEHFHLKWWRTWSISTLNDDWDQVRVGTKGPHGPKTRIHPPVSFSLPTGWEKTLSDNELPSFILGLSLQQEVVLKAQRAPVRPWHGSPALQGWKQPQDDQNYPRLARTTKFCETREETSSIIFLSLGGFRIKWILYIKWFVL